jgi:hypothetical protein
MVIKNTEFHADFESVEKVLKKCTQKNYCQKRDENMHFFTFSYVRQTCFAYNFFVVVFLPLLQRIQNQR